MKNLLDPPDEKFNEIHADIVIPKTPEIPQYHYVWYEIETPDSLPVRCMHCGKVSKVEACVYISGGEVPTIAHKSCLGERWLKQNEQGQPAKKRTAAKIWQIGPIKLRIVRKKKEKKSE